MAEIRTRYNSSLVTTNARIEGLMADFSGMDNLEKIVSSVLHRLDLQSDVRRGVDMIANGSWSIQSFDGWFSEVVRKELGKTLGIVRNKAIAKARAAGAGSASTAVLRRMYRDEYGGNINIAGNRKRISNRKREVPENKGGESGIRRDRYVSARTKELREYYGPDRSFILRFLNKGTDVRTASPYGPTGRGSRATYGNRGSINPRSFFHQLQSDMEQAAQQMGQTLIGHVEEWTKQQFTESK